MSDPCVSFGELNLRHRTDLIEVLKRDKDTRLEGICIEYLFQNDVLLPAGLSDAISDNWWLVGKSGTNQGYYLFKLSVGELTSVDLQVIQRLIGLEIECFTIRLFEDGVNQFRGAKLLDRHVKSPDLLKTEESYLPVSELFKRLDVARGSLPRIPITGRTQERQAKAANFLIRLKRLRTAAVQRLFANCFLSPYFSFVWDIDGFLIHNGKLAVIEVKQKYPTARSTYGINTGVARWMEWFIAKGLQVYHFVLTKPIWDYRVPALDLISNPTLKEKSLWLGTKISLSHFKGTVDTAPSRTSIFADTSLNFYHVPVTAFHLIKRLGEKKSYLQPFLSERTVPIKGIVDIPRIR